MSAFFALFFSFLFFSLLTFGQNGSRQAASPLRTIFDLQQHSQTKSVQLTGGGYAQLINLNTGVGTWYLLELQGTPQSGSFHLEISGSERTTLNLVPEGLQIIGRRTVLCDITNPASSNYLPRLALAPLLFTRLCDTNVSLRADRSRNPQNPLRLIVDNETAARFWAARSTGPALPQQAPLAAIVNPNFQNSPALMTGLAPMTPTTIGQWSAARYHAGVYYSSVSVSQLPNDLPDPRRSTDPLSVEGGARATLVALNMQMFRIGWSHGPLLPGLGHWSQMFPYQSSPDQNGPDEFRTALPLQIQTGVLNPLNLPDLAAVMCGGFQRYHGRFNSAGPHFRKYYGFIQEGVVLASMNEGLATFIIYKDGQIDIKKWQMSDQAQIPNIRFARQNGVPIIDEGMPGDFLAQRLRFQGNWSGSGVDGSYRTPRSGVCLSEHNGQRFLIYSYFDSATPSGMAKTFQAYGCKSAMHLDMNNPQWAYFGLLSRDENGGVFTEWPSRDMAQKDRRLDIGGRQVTLPRFVAEPDMQNPGDFFYFLRR